MIAGGRFTNVVNYNDGAGGRYRKKDEPATQPKQDSGGNKGYSFAGSYKAPSYSYSVSGYDPASDRAYQQALSALQSAYGNTPTYTPTYDAQINDIYNQIMNRGKFKYSLSSDPLYQEAREQYTGQGQMAMMNTMGQAAALTGGYGSSYSQAVGQQQYNAYLQNLNQLVPEYYDRAFNQWQAEGSDLYNKYGLTKDLADTEYSKYRDQMSDYWSNVDYLANQESNAYNRGFENHWNAENANMSNYWNSANLANTNYWKSQDMAFDNYWKSVNAALSQQKAAASSSGSGGSKGGTSGKKAVSGHTQNYYGAIDQLKELTAAGVPSTDIRKALEESYKAGEITRSEYTELFNLYALKNGMKE